MPKTNAKRKAAEGAPVDNSKKAAPHLVKADDVPVAASAETLPGLPPPQADLPPPQPAPLPQVPLEFLQTVEKMIAGQVQPKSKASATLLTRIHQFSGTIKQINAQIAQAQNELSEKQQALQQLASQREAVNGAMQSHAETIWHLEQAAE